MRILAFLTILLPLLFAPVAPILAQETGSSTGAVKDTFDLPTSPLDGLLNKWLGGGQIDLKKAAQEGMTKAQGGLEQAAGQAVGKAQNAIADEISRQADQAIKEARQKAETYVGGVVAIIKATVNDMISGIKIFFTGLFTKPAPIN